MACYNLDGRDSLAGLDSWITREEPLDERDDPLTAENDQLGIRQIYLDRDTAEKDIGFWQNRSTELQRQLDIATIELLKARMRHDRAEAQIADWDNDA